MPAVSDTSPLILYSQIALLPLLQQLFKEIVVPPAVWDEIMVEGMSKPAAREVSTTAWIHRVPLSHPVSDLGFTRRLDLGEAEANALALEPRVRSATIVTDDLPARAEAREHGPHVVGSAGIALLAKQDRLVDEVTPIIADLRAAGLFLSDSVADYLIRIAGE